MTRAALKCFHEAPMVMKRLHRPTLSARNCSTWADCLPKSGFGHVHVEIPRSYFPFLMLGFWSHTVQGVDEIKVENSLRHPRIGGGQACYTYWGARPFLLGNNEMTSSSSISASRSASSIPVFRLSSATYLALQDVKWKVFCHWLPTVDSNQQLKGWNS